MVVFYFFYTSSSNFDVFVVFFVFNNFFLKKISWLTCQIKYVHFYAQYWLHFNILFLYSLKFFESYKMMEKVDFASIFAKDTWL